MADSSDSALKKILSGGTDFLKGPSAAPAPDAAQDDEVDGLSIAQMNGDYSSMRPANKTLTRLHVIKRDGKVVTFQFHYLDAQSTYEGGAFKLLFVGAKLWEVAVKGHGPNFWRIYDLCTLHRWAYLREATGSMPGVGGDEETVLTEIKITDVTPKERE